METVKSGKEKVFYARCGNCASDLHYGLEDVKTEEYLFWKSEIKYIKCPVCNEPIPVDLLTEEEAKEKAKHPFPYSCSCSVG